MTNRLRRLEVAGLVKRIPDPNDGRGLLVALTRKGQRVVDEAVDAHPANEHRLLAALTPSDREVLADLLRRLLLQFEDRQEPTRSRRPMAGGGLTGRSTPRRSAGVDR